MEPFGVRVLLSPELTLSALTAVLAGVALGTVSGLTPGLHANNFALLLVAVAPSVPGPPELVGAAMLAAGVTHTFLDVVPALALGVPDAAMAVTALPGHRLVLAGRGREALRLSALGSGLAVVFAVPLALPLTWLMVRYYPVVRPRLPIALAAVAVYLVATEGDRTARVGAALAFVASAILGLVLLDVGVDGPLPAGDVLAPLFGGLFGAPVLVDALRGGGVPPQADARLAVGRRAVLATAGLGALAGAIVGYVPGVSAAIAAAVVLGALPRGGAREFVVAVSGVNTSNAIFALFALVALGSPRTGVLVALNEAAVPLDLPLLLGAVVVAGAVGAVMVPTVGDRYLAAAGRVDYARLSLGMIAGLAGLSYLFAGPAGVGVFALASAIGMIPPRFGARRVHLMGVLMGPLIVG